MFPEEITNVSTSEDTKYNIISNSSHIRKTPNYNYAQKNIILKNGDVDLVDNYKNVQNWIIKFFRTPIDIYKIYSGSGFGTSAYKLIGKKSISGIEYAQIKKEVEEGFKLNPNILSVEDFNIIKDQKTLSIYVKVKLQDGYILEEKTEIYSIKR